MRKIAIGLAALLAVAFWGPAMAESETERVQETEQPGSEIQIDIGGGGTQIHRADGRPVFGLGENNEAFPDPVDAELPGEGPESLSGPDDDDPLPY